MADRVSPPLISVVVPVYNTAPYLRRCLDSVCGQSYRHLEIICVDDGSTDGSLSILEEYAARDSRVKLLKQAQAGVAIALNNGVGLAQGEYFTRVDSDDYLDLNAYEVIVSQIQGEPDMVCFGAHIVDTSGAPLHDPFLCEYLDARREGYVAAATVEDILAVPIPGWCKLWRRSVILEHDVRFPEGLIHEDYTFFYNFVPWIREMVFVKANLYYYVQRDGSIMHSGYSPLQVLLNEGKAAGAICSYFSQHGLIYSKKEILLHVLHDQYSQLLSLPEEDREPVRAYLASCLVPLELDRKMRMTSPIREILQLKLLKERAWVKPFYCETNSKKSWCFFWFPIWRVCHKQTSTDYRLLGMVVYKRRK